MVSTSSSALAQGMLVVPGAPSEATATAPAPSPAPAPGPAPAGLPPDIVRLKNGGFVRGTILDHEPGVRTVLQTDQGKRTFEGGEIVYAGSVARDPQAMAPSTPSVVSPPTSVPPPAAPLIELRSTTPRVQFFLWTGTSTMTVRGEGDWDWRSSYTATGQGHSFRPLCQAPCSVPLHEGKYRMAVARHRERPVLLEGEVEVRAGVPLRAEYIVDQRSRTVPVLLLVGGAVAVVGGIVTGVSALNDDGEGDVTLPIALVAAGLTGMIVGGIMLPRDADKVRIRPVLPGAANARAAHAPRLSARPNVLGPSFTGTF